MNFAKKLREVVVANFVEISRPEDEQDEATKEQEDPLLSLSDPATLRAPSISTENGVAVADGTGVGTLSLSAEPPAAPAEPYHDPIMAMALGLRDTMATAQAVEYAPVSDPFELIAEDGTIDFERWYAVGGLDRNIAFTAEKALGTLSKLGPGLPLREKRQMLTVVISAMGESVGATTDVIVADAERKRSRLDQYVTDLTERATEIESSENDEIARLRAEIADREARVRDLEERKCRAIATTRKQVDQFDQVVAFFSASDEPAPDSEEEEHDEEIPSFLSDDSVKRMLGIAKAAESAGNGNGHGNGHGSAAADEHAESGEPAAEGAA